MLCHQVLEHLVMYDLRSVDESLVQRVIDKEVAADEFRGILRPTQIFVSPEDEPVAEAALRVVGNDV